MLYCFSKLDSSRTNGHTNSKLGIFNHTKVKVTSRLITSDLIMKFLKVEFSGRGMLFVA